MNVIKLSEMLDGQEAECYAALSRKVRALKKDGQPYWRCMFRDKRAELEAMVWPDTPLAAAVESWTEGQAYRIKGRAKLSDRYGRQLELATVRQAEETDKEHGYDPADLYDVSKFPVAKLRERIDGFIARGIDDPHLKQLVTKLMTDHQPLLDTMPAAAKIHHPQTTGLLEHVWSMTRIAVFLSEHYATYYNELDPPLNRSLVVTAAIVHDLGKLKELEYRPAGAVYSKVGNLLGHIVIGRDMAREAAATIEGFPEELLLQLEHIILSHHGKREFGSPVTPATIEAVLVSYIDDLDAKMNAAARALMDPRGDEFFTEKVFALDNRSLYRGVKIPRPAVIPPATPEPPEPTEGAIETDPRDVASESAE